MAAFSLLPHDFDPIQLLVDRIIKFRVIASGSTKLAQTQAEYERVGFIEGAAAGLAMFLTQERGRLYPHTEHVIEINSWEVLAVLREAHGRGSWLVSADELIKRLRAMVTDEALEREQEQARRDRILDGTELPTEDDRQWLEEHREKFTKVVDPYVKALAKIGQEGYVNG